MPETGRGVRRVPLPGTENAEIAVGSGAIAFDKQGSIWIATLGDGIVRAPYPGLLGSSAVPKTDARLERFTQHDGLTSDYVECVLDDREGNIWFGTNGGLDEFRQAPVVSQSVPGPVRAIVPGAAGSLWIATIAPNSVTRYQDSEANFSWRGPYIDCAYLDRQGFIWLAMPGWPVYGEIFRLDDKGLIRTGGDRSGVAYRYHTSPDTPPPPNEGKTGPPNSVQVRSLDLPFQSGPHPGPEKRVTSMTRDESGRLWAATSSGTFRIDMSRPGSLTNLESLGGPPGMARAEFTDTEGRLWFGFKNEIAMLDGNRVKIFSGNSGVQVGTVRSIQGKGTQIWIGGEFGLEFFDGSRFQPVDPADGSAFGHVSGIVVDSEGGLWFSEDRGIIHINEAQLRQLGSGKVEFESFSSLDGLTAQLIRSPISPSAAQTADGRIWFATTKGLAWVNPKRLLRNTVSPPVLIESVTANGRKYNNSTSLRLPPRIANLQIAYTATSLTVPERVRFRYKLEGQDKEWQDAGTRREAFYTNLDPGTYRFRVIACNNDGVWNEAGTVLHFDVLPAFYQTITFRILCVLALMAALWLLYRLRLKQATARIQQRLGARLDERERIARELHDTLLQSFQGLLLRFQAASNLLPGRPDDAKKKLDHAIKQTSQAIVEGRDAVQGLRSSAAIPSDLADAVRTLGDELSVSVTGTKIPDFEVIVEGVPRTLHPVVRDEVYRIAGEGLRNAFHHAESNRIEVEIHYDATRLRLRIRDDGRGIDPRLLEDGEPVGHWGLQGMRERAGLIGGNFEIWSDVGSGTEVELTLPASVAYGESASRRSPDFPERNQE